MSADPSSGPGRAHRSRTRPPPSLSSSPPPGRGAAWATGFALLFLFLALLAMALVPMRLEREVQEVRARIQNVLEPSESLAARIQALHAREMEAFYSFLLVGDPESRVRYREAQREEQAAVDSLRILAGGMSLRVREALANLTPLSFSWHLGHQEMLTRDLSVTGPPRDLASETFRRRLIEEQEAYRAVRGAARDLRAVLAAEMALGESAMTRARFLQTRYTQILAALGLVATVMVLILAWRLRSLVREAEARREDALRARREVDALLGATGDGVLGMDLRGRCTFLNRAGAELLGYTPLSMVGKDVHTLLHHSYPEGQPLPREECPILGALAAGKALSGRNETLWRSGGRPFPVQISFRPLMEGSVKKGGVLSLTDMTATREAEASLRQAVRDRDEVLAVVSHDLRNPLGTIASAASLLLTLDLSREKRREHLEAVKRSADRINRLIQDLLDVARLDVGALSVHPGPFRVGPLLREVVQAHEARASERDLRLRAEVPDGDADAWGDRHRVIQALTNLVENALRETPAAGEIVLGATEGTDGSGVHFFVSDTGPGIRREDRERLFDRFWQVSRKGRRGAGLGLSIVKGIVDAHGGNVWIESEEGRGSTFWLSLPEAPPEEDTRDRSVRPDPPANGGAAPPGS